MGRQVPFYMTCEDEVSFVEYVRTTCNVCLFLGHAPAPEPVCLDVLPEENVEGWFQLFLWDRDHCPPPLFDYIENRGYYVDHLSSEVIEFSRSSIAGKEMQAGRIWAEFYRVVGDDYVEKGPYLKKWFRKLANWIRRNAVRKEPGGYVLPGAAKFCAEGGKLV